MRLPCNNETYNIQPEDLLLCQPEFIQDHYLRSPDLKCQIMAYPQNSLKDVAYLCIMTDSRWWEKAVYLQTHPILHLDERQTALTECFMQIRHIYSSYPITRERQRILKVLQQAAICEMLSWIGELIEPEEKQKFSHKEVIFRSFISLLQQTNGTQREVQWFAEKLSITPKYLTTISRDISGRPASELINEISVNRIKQLLTTTDLSAKEIAAELGFSNLSFFCKYVKHNLGTNAAEYRRQNR
ncbi:MAG: AraC family transcriptional regulator [Paludibacteraceae bacterium]|nr:AraC family transcriptional regulator [Paludibacteraceae bacterium]